MTNEIKLVLFDMDNVLCDYNIAKRTKRLEEISGMPASDIYAAIWQSGFEYEGDSGALSKDDYLQGFGEKIGYPLSVQEWLDARKAGTVAHEDVLELVKKLKAHVDIAILTNNSELVSDHLAWLLPPVHALFAPHIFASAMFGHKKPSAECFALCLAKLHQAPQAVLFIDDLIENVEGARQAGLHAHHFRSAQELHAVLADYQLI